MITMEEPPRVEAVLSSNPLTAKEAAVSVSKFLAEFGEHLRPTSGELLEGGGAAAEELPSSPLPGAADRTPRTGEEASLSFFAGPPPDAYENLARFVTAQLGKQLGVGTSEAIKLEMPKKEEGDDEGGGGGNTTARKRRDTGMGESVSRGSETKASKEERRSARKVKKEERRIEKDSRRIEKEEKRKNKLLEKEEKKKRKHEGKEETRKRPKMEQ